MLHNPAGTAARELCPGLQPATLQCSATCKILSQGHPINQKIVPACHLQHSTPVLVSANGYHPRVQHTEQISNIQACTCLTKIHNRSVAFVLWQLVIPFYQWTSTLARWHIVKMECHCWVQSMLPGGPTTWRRSLRQCTSNFRSSDLYNFRCPAPKRTAEVTTESKKNWYESSGKHFLSHKIHLFA